MSVLKVVNTEYMHTARSFPLSFNLPALNPALMAAQFHSICLVKVVYVAQWNFRINPSRVATSPQIKKSITYISISDLPNAKTCARESGLG